jgi:hypothetical protein
MAGVLKKGKFCLKCKEKLDGVNSVDCKGCELAWYCSKECQECQEEDFSHQHFCRKVQTCRKYIEPAKDNKSPAEQFKRCHTKCQKNTENRL